jgi:lipid II:glycine glycyltransferase (peptidoglycan interpeptide bridge formation enzyme)
MIEKFYEKKNNLLQSPEWAEFRKSLGEELLETETGFGTILNLPFGKKFVWFQKASVEMPLRSELPKGTVFVRVEPEKDPGKKFKRVTFNSLLSGQRSPKNTRVLDLTKPEEELLSEMKSKTRYNIRLAEKKKVVVEETNNVDELYQMLAETSGRDKGYHPHQKDYYQKLMTELGPKGIAKIYLAKFEGKVIAGILVTTYSEVATYLHGGFSDKYKNLMAPYLCQWVAIKEAKKNGATFYDFWGTAETERDDDPWAGITRFKVGFGGEEVAFPGTFDYIVSPFWYNLLTMLAKIRKLFR